MYDLAVVGLGYVGLPLAVEAARSGLTTYGLDIDAAKVAGLAAGTSHVEDIADREVVSALDAGFVPGTDPGPLGGAAVVVICVPTPLRDHAPDLSAIEAAGRTVAERLNPGTLVSLESTSYPGTTEEFLLPLLEAGSGLKAGIDFHLVFSPERIDPRNPEWGFRNTPKVVGGIDEASTTRAVEFYSVVCDEVVAVRGTREAEMSKLLENTYRHVNIALVNELAIFCRELGIDIWEAIRAASTKPFGFQAFTPGPGVGGHCIPIDPSYLSFKVRQMGYQFRLVESAQDINARMPAYVVQRAGELLNRHGAALNGTAIHLIGLAYKPGVADLRASPAVEVARRLRRQGAAVGYSDPHVPEVVIDGERLVAADDPVAAAGAAKLTIVLTPHPEFDLTEIAKAADLVLDTRGVVSEGFAERL
jgi:UDP-N-acetyl-D-glucosamine dehydrogenase